MKITQKTQIACLLALDFYVGEIKTQRMIIDAKKSMEFFEKSGESERIEIPEKYIKICITALNCIGRNNTFFDKKESNMAVKSINKEIGKI